MIIKDLNWAIVVICAIQRALTSRTYVNYAIRDHVLSNLEYLPSQYRAEMADDIARYLPQVEIDRPETVVFWQEFQTKLLESD